MWDLQYKESWAPKNWCFWTVVLEKTLESPLDCKEIQPVHPKGNQPWISLEGLMLKLKLQYFGHLMQRTDSLEKTLMWGKIEGRRRRGRQGWNGWMASPTQWTWVWVNSGSWWWTGRPGVLQSMGLERVGHEWATELNWRVHYLCPPSFSDNELYESQDSGWFLFWSFVYFQQWVACSSLQHFKNALCLYVIITKLTKQCILILMLAQWLWLLNWLGDHHSVPSLLMFYELTRTRQKWFPSLGCRVL